MKIFSPNETNISKTTNAPKKTGKAKGKSAASKIKGEAPAKAPVSDREIREKLAAHVQTSNTAKSQVFKKNSEALGAGFMNPDVKPKIETAVTAEGVEEKGKSLKESHLLLSDVKLNDPTDSNTQEKLKSVLGSGAFNFNPKERENLERILGGN